MTIWLAATFMAVALLAWPRGRQRSVAAAAAARKTTAVHLPTAVVLDLLCAALEAGLSTQAALGATLDACAEFVAPNIRDGLLAVLADAGCARRPVGNVGELLGLTRALYLADRTGASVAPLLRRAAVDARAERRQRTAVAAGRLGVRLVLPLGLATLPAFVLLGVVPVVLGLAHQVLELN